MNLSHVDMSERLRSPHGRRQMVARLRLIFDAVRRDRSRLDVRGWKHSTNGDESRSRLRAREARIERERQAMNPALRDLIWLLAEHAVKTHVAEQQENLCSEPQSTPDTAPTYSPSRR